MQGLIWISKQPKCPGQIGETRHAGVHTATESTQVVLLGIVQGMSLLEMHASQDDVPYGKTKSILASDALPGGAPDLAWNGKD